MPEQRITREELDLHRAFGQAVTELLAQQQTLFHQQRRTERELTERLDKLEKTIMTALDDLKTNIAGLIAEATGDITALVQKMQQAGQSQGGVSEADVEQLARQVADATANMHTAFLAATGTPVPATTQSGASSNATASEGGIIGDQTGATGEASADPVQGDTGDETTTSGDQSGATSIGPGSFKAGA